MIRRSGSLHLAALGEEAGGELPPRHPLDGGLHLLGQSLVFSLPWHSVAGCERLRPKASTRTYYRLRPSSNLQLNMLHRSLPAVSLSRVEQLA
jgi:hypothetical protein